LKNILNIPLSYIFDINNIKILSLKKELTKKYGYSKILSMVLLCINVRLKTRYPLIRFDLSDKNKEIPIFDQFYIDFNALVYQCIRVYSFINISGKQLFLKK